MIGTSSTLGQASGGARKWTLCWVLVIALFATACESGTPDVAPASPPATGGPTTTASTPTTTEVLPEPLSEPAARGYHRMVHVGGDLGVLLLAGFTGSGPPSVIPQITTTDAAWAYTPADGWTDLGLVGYEEMPTLNDAVYHADSGRVVLISMGVTASLPELVSATYLYDPTTGVVEPMAAEGPLALIGARAAYDSESDRVIVFGGLTFRFQEVDDIWAYDVDTDTWTEVASDTGPGPRYYHAMVHDPGTDRMILFGGVTGRDEAPLDDTWAFDVATETWTQLSTASTPSPRGWHAMAYDPVMQRTILFGGENASRPALAVTFEEVATGGEFTAVIDVTTTEVCDLLLGGVLACTEDRFGAIARTQVPFVGSCGALDMVNFGALDTVPAQYRGRNLYVHNPQVTLMRTTAEECARIGRWIGERLNRMELGKLPERHKLEAIFLYDRCLPEAASGLMRDAILSRLDPLYPDDSLAVTNQTTRISRH